VRRFYPKLIIGIGLVFLLGWSLHKSKPQTKPQTAPKPTLTKAMKRCFALEDKLRSASIESFGSDEYTLRLMAQGRQESACLSNARSKYAYGTFQFTPSTGRDLILNGSCSWYGKPLTKAGQKRLLLNEDWSVRCGAKYMSQLLSATRKKFWPDDEAYRAALAAYNGGLGYIIGKEYRLAVKKGYPVGSYTQGVMLVCVRAEWACKENHAYAAKILDHWLPLIEALKRHQ